MLVSDSNDITFLTRAGSQRETIGFVASGAAVSAGSEEALDSRIRALGQENEEIVVVATSRSVARLIAAVSEMIASADESSESLIEAMLPQTQVVSEASARQAQLNASARQAVLDEFAMYDSEGVA